MLTAQRHALHSYGPDLLPERHRANFAGCLVIQDQTCRVGAIAVLTMENCPCAGLGMQVEAPQYLCV